MDCVQVEYLLNFINSARTCLSLVSPTPPCFWLYLSSIFIISVALHPTWVCTTYTTPWVRTVIRIYVIPYSVCEDLAYCQIKWSYLQFPHLYQWPYPKYPPSESKYRNNDCGKGRPTTSFYLNAVDNLDFYPYSRPTGNIKELQCRVRHD